MVGEWYRSSKGIKEYFENHGEFENLEHQLEELGILFEGDFDGLVTSQFIEHSCTALKELFFKEDCEYGYIGSTIHYLGEGWMYFLYDSDKLTLSEARKMADSHFRKKLKIKH
ncbi:hypothetical protein [Streptococcus suis]